MAIAVSGAQYVGDELMKFKGDVVSPLEDEHEVTEGCVASVMAEGLRAGLTPFAEMGVASDTGFRGTLVS